MITNGGRPGIVLRLSWSLRGSFWGVMGLPWVSWDCLGALLGRPGAVLGRLGANVGPSGTPRRRPRAVLGPSWGVLEPIGANLEPQEGAGSGPMRAPRGSQEASWTATQHRVRFGALHVHEMLFFTIRNAPPGKIRHPPLPRPAGCLPLPPDPPPRRGYRPNQNTTPSARALPVTSAPSCPGGHAQRRSFCSPQAPISAIYSGT